MKIVYFTSGITGSGRIVRGIAIGNALKRKEINTEYIILNSSKFTFLADTMGVGTRKIPVENEDQLSFNNYKTSELYKALMLHKPDILIIDLLWFPLYYFINELQCKKVFLCRQVDDRFFNIRLGKELLTFRPEDFDLLLAIEPFQRSLPMRQINPIVIRNRDEILPREVALQSLGLDGSTENCLITYNGEPGEYEQVMKDYSHLKDAGYRIYSTTNYKDGIFPSVDYFNAFDLVICGAGYNSYWETVYFKKEAFYSPATRAFETGRRRIEECAGFEFDENGADQLVDIVCGL